MSIRAWLLFLALLVPTPRASADAVGAFDPELAELCGGSAHAPNCRAGDVGMACCGLGFVALVGVGVLLAARGRRDKQ